MSKLPKHEATALLKQAFSEVAWGSVYLWLCIAAYFVLSGAWCLLCMLLTAQLTFSSFVSAFQKTMKALEDDEQEN